MDVIEEASVTLAVGFIGPVHAVQGKLAGDADFMSMC
jgi:hypothetical protein